MRARNFDHVIPALVSALGAALAPGFEQAHHADRLLGRHRVCARAEDGVAHLAVVLGIGAVLGRHPDLFEPAIALDDGDAGFIIDTPGGRVAVRQLAFLQSRHKADAKSLSDDGEHAIQMEPLRRLRWTPIVRQPEPFSKV